MKYYFDGKRFHSTSCRITGKWVHTKNSVYRNFFGAIYSSKKSALRCWIREVKHSIKMREEELAEKGKEIQKMQRDVKRCTKILSRMKI